MTPDDGHIYDAVIVGGGIAGLTAAWELRDKDVVVLEADDRVGGRIMSLPRGDYWINVGAHLFPPPESPTGRLVTAVGLETETIPGDTMAIHLNGKLTKGGSQYLYPLRLKMPLKARLSFVKAGMKLRWGIRKYQKNRKLNALGPEGRHERLAFLGDQSFKQYLGDVHPDVDALFRIVARRLTAPLEDLAAGSGLTVVAHAWSGSDSDQQRNLRGGSARLPEAIRRNLGERVVTGASVAKVWTEDGLAHVSYSIGGQAQEAVGRTVIVATQAPIALEILQGLPDDVRDALKAVRYGPFVVAGILTDENGPMPWDGLYAVAAANRSFNMLFNVVNITRSGARQPGGSLMCYGGGELGEKLLAMSDDEVREAFLNDIYDIFPEARGVVKEVFIRKLPMGMPYVYPGRYKIQPALEKSMGNVFLAGDYLEWAHMEAAITTAQEAAGKARAVITG